ncbi:MAG: cytidine deaminase [Candidatus Berkelbacteria bacterium]|nr:cytidine deaminase [Candidatus Berkelbacteria bacterium]
MEVNQKLYGAAQELLAQHPDQAVSACYTEDGQILTGVSTESPHDQACLCAETGPICEAQKLKKKIVASICIAKEDKTGRVIVYTPCGICQERFFLFGEDLQVAIPQEDDPTKWQSVPLKQAQPYWWKKAKLG